MRTAKTVVNTFGRALRESGQAMDRLGCNIAGVEVYKSTLSRHRMVMPLGIDFHPVVSAKQTFIAPTAAVIGNVNIAEGGSVWYGAVLRADTHETSISVGARSNIQDRSVLTGSINIGQGVTVGHGALMEGTITIGDNCLIGQGSIIGTGCVVEAKSILAAGAVLLPRTTVPTGQMWAGNPAKFVRACKPDEMATFEPQAVHYMELGAEHAKEF
jgi:gamma-carbonic anhydrase